MSLFFEVIAQRLEVDVVLLALVNYSFHPKLECLPAWAGDLPRGRLSWRPLSYDPFRVADRKFF
jgi:hypothetical protein